MKPFIETWREFPQPKAQSQPRHLIEAHRKIIFLIFNLSSDSHAKFFNVSAYGRLERWSNSQKLPKIPPQIDIDFQVQTVHLRSKI